LPASYIDAIVFLVPVIQCCNICARSIIHKLVGAFYDTLEEGWDKIKERLSVFGGEHTNLFKCLNSFTGDFVKKSSAWM